MTDVAMAKATALLAKGRLVDGHNDLPYVIWRQNGGDVRAWNMNRLHPEHDTDLPKLKAGGVSTQIFTAFLPTNQPDPLRARLEIIDTMLQMEQAYPEAIHPVLEPADLARARRAGKLGLLKAVEGLVGVDRLAHLRLFHAMGIRLITLCHNERLPFIDSATDDAGPEPLTEFGRAIIAEMERLGLMIDLAHVSPAAQAAALDCAKGPVLISHANAHALCPHPRNAPDAIIRRIADRGGIVMATFVPAFLAPAVFDALKPVMDPHGKALAELDRTTYQRTKKQAFSRFSERDGVQWLCDHLDHMKNLVGAEAIGIGSDFYGGPNPPGLEDASTFPKIFAELIRRGWSTGDLERLSHRNFERVWRDVYRAAPQLAV